MVIKEEWRYIADFNKKYAISNHGRVYNYYKNIYLAQFPNDDGYLRVRLQLPNTSPKSIFVHKLVLEGFVGPRPTKMVCRHYPDQTKTNNLLTNLSWDTETRNALDRIEAGTAGNGKSLSIETIKAIKTDLILGNTITFLAKKYGTSLTRISNIKNGKMYTEIGQDMTKIKGMRTKHKRLCKSQIIYAKLLLNTNQYTLIQIAKAIVGNPTDIYRIKQGTRHSKVLIPQGLTLQEAMIKISKNESLEII